VPLIFLEEVSIEVIEKIGIDFTQGYYFSEPQALPVHFEDKI